MPTQFFNFGNDETFHFFKWVCESLPAGAEDLIADAFKRAEQLDSAEFPDEGVCLIARNRLADKLREILYKTAPDLNPDTNILDIGVILRNSDGSPSADSLLNPIYALALDRINCERVAEALLIRAGKWAPSREPPEVL